MDFAEAKDATLQEIRSEVPDNGIHMSWINAKTAAAERMTESSYRVVIARREKDSWDEDYQVARVIYRYMNGLSAKPKPALPRSPPFSEPAPAPISPPKSNNCALSFAEARARALEEIEGEEPDNGSHAAWIASKKAEAEGMTEESLATILENGSGVSPLNAKYQAARIIEHFMKDGWM